MFLTSAVLHYCIPYRHDQYYVICNMWLSHSLTIWASRVSTGDDDPSDETSALACNWSIEPEIDYHIRWTQLHILLRPAIYDLTAPFWTCFCHVVLHSYNVWVNVSSAQELPMDESCMVRRVSWESRRSLTDSFELDSPNPLVDRQTTPFWCRDGTPTATLVLKLRERLNSADISKLNV